MKKYILLIVSTAVVSLSKAQGFELTGHFLSPGYTLAAGYGVSVKNKLMLSAGVSYLFNNRYKYRSSNINYHDAFNAAFLDRMRGFYIRLEEPILKRPKFNLNLMQYLNYQMSDRDRPGAIPFGEINGEKHYLYQRLQDKSLYYLEYYLGFSLTVKVRNNLSLRSQVAAGFSRSPQNLGPDLTVVSSEFAQNGGIGLIYHFNRKKNAE